MRTLGPDEARSLQRDELLAVWPEVPLDEMLARHAERDGFRLVAEHDEQGNLAGIAYGYHGAPGQWWHDHVAAAMGAEDRARWLAPGHFELVELAVRPDLRRRGLGARLHDAVLEGERTAVLSTQLNNEPALSLYRLRGWQIVVPEIDFGRRELFCVLGNDAPSGSNGRVGG